tara:strand:+ start:133 stop:843 length:711 start_codon:yes stop_codon:yes gene_type:complete
MSLEKSLPASLAVVIGGTGSIGSAFAEEFVYRRPDTEVMILGRETETKLDLLSEDSISDAAVKVASRELPVSVIVVATGILHTEFVQPEKTWRQINQPALDSLFRLNAIGPMLVMKHFLPLLPKLEKSIFACLSARVGSITDNELGGWYGYRASKAALNQFVKTASIELSRIRPEAICMAIHPGTVATRLSDPFSKNGLNVLTPRDCAKRLYKLLSEADVRDNGGFFDYEKRRIPW